MTNFVASMDRTVKQLMQLGLSKKEAQVYIALLEIGRATAYKVAKQAGLKRPTVYLLLEELRKKGLVSKVPHAKNQIFIAKNPEEFFAEIEYSLSQARRTLPELLAKRIQNNISTQLFEGKHELEQALEYHREELAEQELLAFYGAPINGKKVPDMYHRHAQALRDQNTHVRVFAPDDESLKIFRDKDKEYGQDAVYLPKEKYFPRVSVEVGQNLSKIFLHGVSQALVIENKEFATFMRQVFELIWEKEKNKYRSYK